ALLFDHPDDERIWEFPLQWMLGDALLVAPVCEPGVDVQPVYVPAGEWVDAWSGSPVAGGAVVEVDAPLDRIPVLCAAARARELTPLFAEAAPSRQPSLEAL